MSFWQADTKLAIGQKSVSIPAEVQGEYGENDKIIIKIDPSVEFFQPTESYLQFRLKLKLGDNDNAMRLQLDDRIGAHSLIRDCRIMSGTGVVLEECIGWNVLCYQMNTYDSNDNIRRKRAVSGEGSTIYNPACRGTKGGARSDANACLNNPYFNNTAVGTDADYQYVKVCLPLSGSGVFRNPKIFPVMLTQGLRIEIFTEEARKCIQRLDTVSNQTANSHLVPLLNSLGVTNGVADDEGIPKANQAITAVSKADPGVITCNGHGLPNRTKIKISGVVGMIQLNGNTYYTSAVAANTFRISLTAGGAEVDGNAFNAWTSGGVIAIEEKEIELTVDNNQVSLLQCPFVKNESLTVQIADGTEYRLPGKIDTVASVGNKVQITMTEALNITEKADGTAGTAVIPTDSRVLDNTPTMMDTAFNPLYTLDDVQLVLQKIIMPAGYISSMMKNMKQNGMLRYDFMAMQTYKYSMLLQDREGTIMLPLQNSQAKSMLCCPVDASSYTSAQAVTLSDSFAFRGHPDQITEYRFTYNGKLNPDRPVPLSNVNNGIQEQQHLIELDKALAMANITPACMRYFDEVFIVPRALSLQGGSYDTRSKDFQLQVSYRERKADGSDNPPVKNKLWHIFVSHVRSIIVKQGDVMVQV